MASLCGKFVWIVCNCVSCTKTITKYCKYTCLSNEEKQIIWIIKIIFWHFSFLVAMIFNYVTLIKKKMKWIFSYTIYRNSFKSNKNRSVYDKAIKNDEIILLNKHLDWSINRKASSHHYFYNFKIAVSSMLRLSHIKKNILTKYLQHRRTLCPPRCQIAAVFRQTPNVYTVAFVSSSTF